VGAFEAIVFGAAGVVLPQVALYNFSTYSSEKTKPSFGGIPGKPFLLTEFHDVGGADQGVARSTGSLTVSQLTIAGSLELAGEAMSVRAERAEGAVGIDDVESHAGLFIGGIGGAGEQVGFEEGDAVEAPGGVGEIADELALRWRWRVGIRLGIACSDAGRRRGLRRARRGFGW
jgi:hypothetical protein